MDYQYVALLLGIIHSSQEVDPWFGQVATQELNRIKAEALKSFAPEPKAIPTAQLKAKEQPKVIDLESEGLETSFKPEPVKRSL